MNTSKESTKQEYARRMDRVVDHIREHLDQELPLERLAGVACFSPYHFHRIFRGMVGESVKSYVRRLRLERAAGKLKQTATPVTTIAFEAGFAAHESFTRAFQTMFGCSPLAYRKACQVENSHRQIHYWKEMKMKVDIVTLEEMKVVFVRHTGPYTACGAAWETLCSWAGPKGLLQPGARILGLSYDDPEVTPPEKLRYEACIQIDQPLEVEPPLGIKEIKEGRYAMTTHFGPYEELSASYARLCGQWIPQNGHQIDNRACLEIYHNNPEDTEPEELITDIYVPLA
ncbi:AraC family transcriptional regulator [Desulfogranum mediterraneum]|uniref:AraC family transcriptional regulator n=1 Tax=Desulfogranum mediterraneum TaxID=160661 RepID=UPI00048E9995|nr:AraC family transcriptional regulator [Desulfogranum mediterraneum]